MRDKYLSNMVQADVICGAANLKRADKNRTKSTQNVILIF